MQQGPPKTPPAPVATKPVQHSASFRVAIGAGISAVLASIPDILHAYNSHQHMIPDAWQPLFARLSVVLTIIAVIYNRFDVKQAANEYGPQDNANNNNNPPQ